MKKTFSYESIIGDLTIVQTKDKITEIIFGKDLKTQYEVEETDLIIKTKDQILEYLEGKRETFDIPYELEGTEFQLKVWKALEKIPYGETRSYKDVAEMIQNPKAYRAVGGANNKNPISIIVP